MYSNSFEWLSKSIYTIESIPIGKISKLKHKKNPINEDSIKNNTTTP